jgi:hypothetical protein
MATRHGRITQRHETVNTTARWLVVANYHIVLGSYATEAKAWQAICSFGKPGPDGLADAAYAVVDVLAPGESRSGEMAVPVAWEDGETADAVLAQIFG